MILRFIAREDALAHVPGAPYAVGQAAAFVGRSFVCVKGSPPAYPATREPHEVTLNEATKDGINRFARYQKMAMRGDIWPADAETAAACGVDLPSVAFMDGEWKLAAKVDVRAAAAQPPTPSVIADKQPEKRTRKESD